MTKINKKQGFSLLEVLIALFLMALGLLALLKLQMQSIRVSQSAFVRNQAVILTNDLFDRIRANPEIGVLINADSVEITAVATSDKDCIDEACSSQEMANFEITEWGNSVVNRLPNGGATITAGTPDASSSVNAYTITISWDDRHSLLSDIGLSSAFTRTEFSTTTELQYEFKSN